MKINVTGFKFIINLLNVFLFLVATPPTFGGISGGPGVAITPYDKDVKEDEIKTVKDASSKSRRIRNVELKEGKKFGLYDEVGLAFVINKEIKPESIFYKFVGKPEETQGDKSKKRVEIDFSEIKSLSVIQTNEQALLEVVKFPDISPEELFKNKELTYSELKKKYETKSRFWLETKDKEKGELSLVGKGYSGVLETIAKIQNMKLNTIIEFDYGTFAHGSRKIPSIWWATPWVIKDPNFPHKITVKK